ncbi:hypothetical protein C8Q77DRAFT_262706 [Trametes polyzona]|nr:hypothetical protein C8Q77DRAFT_262706 [Trametes polyzona]
MSRRSGRVHPAIGRMFLASCVHAGCGGTQSDAHAVPRGVSWSIRTSVHLAIGTSIVHDSLIDDSIHVHSFQLYWARVHPCPVEGEADAPSSLSSVPAQKTSTEESCALVSSQEPTTRPTPRLATQRRHYPVRDRLRQQQATESDAGRIFVPMVRPVGGETAHPGLYLVHPAGEHDPPGLPRLLFPLVSICFCLAGGSMSERRIGESVDRPVYPSANTGRSEILGS